MKDDLLGADLLGNEFWMNNTHPQLYDDCVQEFLQGPGGLM
jgi:hypothetical protein